MSKSSLVQPTVYKSQLLFKTLVSAACCLDSFLVKLHHETKRHSKLIISNVIEKFPSEEGYKQSFLITKSSYHQPQH